jgi:hypothetical protein
MSNPIVMVNYKNESKRFPVNFMAKTVFGTKICANFCQSRLSLSDVRYACRIGFHCENKR